MERIDSDPVLKLQIEIEKEIKRRRFYEYFDFSLAHIFLWISILSSFGASIIIASNPQLGVKPEYNKIIIAIIAAIPGLIIVTRVSRDIFFICPPQSIPFSPYLK